MTDIIERDKEYAVHVELPGIDKKDVNIELNEGILTIFGERKHEKKHESENAIIIERSYGSFSRSMQLPEGVTEDQLKAKMEHGVLEITFPKTTETPSKKKKIAIA